MQSGELEILRPRSRRDVDDARSFVHRDLVPGDHAMLDRRARRKIVEWAFVTPADQLRALQWLVEVLVRITGSSPPLAVEPAAVVSLRINRGRDVCRKRPRR